LLDGYVGSADATPVRAKIDQLLQDGKASIVDTSYQVSRSGQRCKIESIKEVIYPTEFDPPEIPREVHGPIDAKNVSMSPASPAAFETRNTGITVEADPVVGADGKTIDINITAEHVSHPESSFFGEGLSEIEQPVFRTTKISTAVSTSDGAYVIIGVGTPRMKGDASYKAGDALIVFARVDLLAVNPGGGVVSR
jgi:general secretion pathway protein D